MEPTTEKGVFMVYNETSKAYRVYILALRKIMIRRNVKFEEESALKKSLECALTILQEEEQQAPKQEAQPSPQTTTILIDEQAEQHKNEGACSWRRE